MYKNRVGWAHDSLKRAGLSQSLKRGYWQLTTLGMQFIKDNKQPLPAEEIARLARGFNEVRLRPASGVSVVDDVIQEKNFASPDEQLYQAMNELRLSVIAAILEKLGTVEPSFFEKIVLDVLHRMGYGANRNDLQRVGGTGDGGIDGVISLDKLGLEKVYVQAKRWQQSVGRPEIQAFFGAIKGQRASKGVFITTSSYTNQAIEYAKTVEGIVLVDGQKFASLMVENEVGVSSLLYKIPKIDNDYFEEDIV